MPKPDPIETLDDAFAQALAAHETFADDERLVHVSIGRYNADLGGRSNLGGSYYWQVNAERIRTLTGPAETTTSPKNLVAQRLGERKDIIDAYNAARDRLAKAAEGEGV